MKPIKEHLRARQALTKHDWERALIALEIVFANSYYGAAPHWEIVSDWDDDRTLRVLRGIQRKVTPMGFRAAAHRTVPRPRRMNTTLYDTQLHEIELEDGTTGRIPGTLVVDERTGDEVYLTVGNSVLFHDVGRHRVSLITDPREGLKGLDPDAYAAAAQALRFKPVIDL
jgi:hypothetical protein